MRAAASAVDELDRVLLEQGLRLGVGEAHARTWGEMEQHVVRVRRRARNRPPEPALVLLLLAVRGGLLLLVRLRLGLVVASLPRWFWIQSGGAASLRRGPLSIRRR